MSKLISVVVIALAVVLSGCPDSSHASLSAFNTAVLNARDIRMPAEVAQPAVLSTVSVVTELDNSDEGNADSKAPAWDSVSLASDFALGTCTIRQEKSAPGYSELFLLDPTTSVIWPGAILDGSSFEDGSYRLISGGVRKPIDISVSIIGVKNAATTIPDPAKLSQARQAISDLLGADDVRNQKPGGFYTFSLDELYASDQFALNVGAHFETTVFVRARSNFNLNYDTNTSKNRVAGNFQHKYYSVDVDTPDGPQGMYSVPPQISPAVTPVYVSSITYGRTAVISALTSESLGNFKRSFDRAVFTLFGSGGDNFDFSNRAEVRNSKTYVTVAGGSGTTPVTDLASFYGYVRDQSIKYIDGVPLSYTLKSLKDNSVVRTVLSSEYTVRDCQAIPKANARAIKLKINSLQGDSADEPVGAPDGEFYGKISVSPTASAVSNSVGCTIDEERLVFDRPISNPITRVPAAGLSISDGTPGFLDRDVYVDTGTTPNLLVCAQLFELDADGSDEIPATGQIVAIGAANFGAENSNSIHTWRPAQFGSDHWLRAQFATKLLRF